MRDRIPPKVSDGPFAPGMLFPAVGLTLVSACNGGGATDPRVRHSAAIIQAGP